MFSNLVYTWLITSWNPPHMRQSAPVHIIDFLFYYLAGIEILHFWNFGGNF